MILRAIVRTGSCYYRRGVCHRQGPGCCLSFLLLHFTRRGLARKRSHTAQSVSQSDRRAGGVPLTIALRRPGLSTALVRDGLAAGNPPFARRVPDVNFSHYCTGASFGVVGNKLLLIIQSATLVFLSFISFLESSYYVRRRDPNNERMFWTSVNLSHKENSANPSFSRKPLTYDRNAYPRLSRYSIPRR